MNRDDVIEAIAQVYTKKEHERKELDACLASSIADAIMELQEGENKPEWEKAWLKWRVAPRQDGRDILHFIRTEIIEKICEEIKSGLHDEDKFWPDEIKAKWLKGE